MRLQYQERILSPTTLINFSFFNPDENICVTTSKAMKNYVHSNVIKDDLSLSAPVFHS